MLYFENDYSEGAHRKVLDALVNSNEEKLSGYGSDEYCLRAKNKIKEACGIDKGEVYFISGGTQTNQLVIDTYLNSYEGVIACNSGHIALHEGGAIECRGHKVMVLPHHEGKIDYKELEDYVETFYNDGNRDHMVHPGMVYISYPSEYGTLYTKDELIHISEICKKYHMTFYIDGARLGYGLVSKECDLTLKDISSLCDVFYIGGTKVGALCGEAIVFTHDVPKHFITIIKQHGALLAKGRLLGVQFDALFTDHLYYEISKNAIETSELLKEGLHKKNYTFYLESPTNQQFIIMENKALEEFGKKVRYSFWEKYDDDHTVIRLATSWATTKEEVEELIKIL